MPMLLTERIMFPVSTLTIAKSIVRRQEGIDLTEEILLKYRREGKFFDEILRGE